MKILAIDTSCDDTAISVLKAQNKGCFELLSDVVSSQVKIHQKYGGVYPTLAKREHQRNLVPVLKKAMGEAKLLEKSKCQMSNVKSNPNVKCQILEKILIRESELYKSVGKFFQNYKKPKIDAVAVTVGPGLEPCLWQGVNFAKALGFYWNLPIIPINHIEAHILANFLQKISEISKFQFDSEAVILNPSLSLRINSVKDLARTMRPFGECLRVTPPVSFPNPNFQKMLPAVGLVVSGGHSQLVLMKKIGQYKIIGETRDDAAGECLDKTARILGLGYPGGPAIAAEARGQTPAKSRGLTPPTSLPRPMLNSKDYDFSFSGLKTAVLYDYRKRPEKVRKSKEYIGAMAKEIQQAVIDVLIQKTIRAAKQYGAKTIILGGGVAANDELRRQFNQKLITNNPKLNFFVPQKNFCTDNAAMVAITAFFHQKNKKLWQKIRANANLRI